MSTRPWMPLYIGDYLADTQHLGAYEHGAYLLLLMHHWHTGKLSGNDEQLSRIAKVHPPHWPRIKRTLISFFEIQEDGSWLHKRVTQELIKAEEISNKRRGAALQKHSKSTAKAQQLHTQSQSQSHKKEDKNEIEKEFLEFWMAYPKKKAKQDAIKAYRAVRQSVSHQILMAGLLAAIKSDHRFSSSVYTPFPASWLRSGCYEDESSSAPATDKNRFRAYSDSPQFKAWKSHFQDNKNLVLVRELNQRELEGRPFSFESEWPPNHGGSNGSSVGVDAGSSGTSKISAINGQVGPHEPAADRKNDGSIGGCRQAGA